MKAGSRGGRDWGGKLGPDLTRWPARAEDTERDELAQAGGPFSGPPAETS